MRCLLLNNSPMAGHADGKVSGWVLAAEPGHSVSRGVTFQAFSRNSAVSAMCLSPWGELWTGNTRGFIRCAPDPVSCVTPAVPSVRSGARHIGVHVSSDACFQDHSMPSLSSHSHCDRHGAG